MVSKLLKLSESETAVLKTLWRLGPSTARAINEDLQSQGYDWAHTTVLTLLQRLAGKGCVDIDKSGFAHEFRAAVTREKLLRRRMADLVEDFCDGAASPLLQALVKGHRFSETEIAEFRELLDELENRSKS